MLLLDGCLTGFTNAEIWSVFIMEKEKGFVFVFLILLVFERQVEAWKEANENITYNWQCDLI